jgi:PPK2 family polyphosphate:nucleotide phosphotransferase
MSFDPVPADTAIQLTDAAAEPPPGALAKAEAQERIDGLTKRLDALQEALYAEGKRAVLVILQGRDTSGKDGATRRVFGPLNPQGLVVTGFKVPTPLERSHDFLWRIHLAVPPAGAIGIFNRSQYEDVLVVRVHQLVPEAVWRPRYEQINQFEKMLTDNGVTILKFCLHISRKEQRERLAARLDDPAKYWKFSAGDLDERKRWGEYTAAYEEMLLRTSTAWAPWYLVPADKKFYRDLFVAEVVTDRLTAMAPQYPGPPEDLDDLRRRLA